MSEEKQKAQVVNGELRPELVDTVDFIEEEHKDKLATYGVTVGDEEFSCRRSIVCLMKELAERDQSDDCRVLVRNYDADAEGEKMKTYLLSSGSVEEVMEVMAKLIVPANDLINQVMGLLMSATEFTDASTVMVTGIFEKQGVCGFTWSNPDIELTEEGANMVYESAKSHAENYKDNTKKKFDFSFASDGGIVKANMSDLRKVTRR